MPNTDHLRFDTRMLKHNLRDGKLTRDDYKAHLESIEDSSENVEYIDPYADAEGEAADKAEEGGDTEAQS